MHAPKPQSVFVKGGARRRGVALLLAIFAMVLVGGSTAAYVSSRETNVMVARNSQAAADARSLAAAGMDLTKMILRDTNSNWRTLHSQGQLLSNYSLDGGTLTVNLVDIVKRAAGNSNPVPDASTTQVEVTVSSTRNGTTWTSVADMSIPSVVKGQYAIFANRILQTQGSSNFIGRWPNAPMSAQNLRVNLGTNALTSSQNGGSPWQGYGVWLGSGTTFESTVAGAVPQDPDTMKSTWVYFPNAAASALVQGSAASLVAPKRMDASETTTIIAAPASPSVVSPFTSYTTTQVVNGGSRTYNSFRVKAALLPQLFTRNFEVRNSATVTLNAGTYEVWGSWIIRDSRIIINGDVKFVVNPNLALTGLDWQNCSVELNDNSSLIIYNGYSMDVRNAWVGKRYTCSSESNPSLADGDPHKKAWFNGFTANACFAAPPSSPQYIEPWRIKFYPMAQFLSSFFMWDITDSAIVGSLYLPSNPIRLLGQTKIYGRIACNSIVMYDQSKVYYDHGLDAVTGLTEGYSPSRGGDPNTIYPVRQVRYGFDAENAR